MITSQEILDQAGIKAAKTLTRWHQRGLIPAPTIGTHPNGKGKIAYWPDYVLGQCIQIRKVLRDGKSLDEVARIIGESQPTESNAQPSQYARVWRNLRRAEAEDTFCNAVADEAAAFVLGIRRHWKDVRPQIDKLLSDTATINDALKLLKTGSEPVLIYDGEQARIVSAKQLGRNLKASVIVIPIAEKLATAFQELLPAPDDKAAVKPAARRRSARRRDQ